MSNNNDNRVIGRVGARQLTSEELEQTAGGGNHPRKLDRDHMVSSPDTDMDS